MQTQIELRNLVPNPFRHMEHYPINEEKVGGLLASYRTTGFWGNVVGRRKGKVVELAYGHHRLVALRRKYKPGELIAVIVKELSDAEMLKIMADENMAEWQHGGFIVDMESVAAVVEAYAKGQIDLGPVPEGARLSFTRYAPSYVAGRAETVSAPSDTSSCPYTAQMVAEFLGWVSPNGQARPKVSDALSALEYIEEGFCKRESFVGLTMRQAGDLLSAARNSSAARTARLKQQAAEAAAKEAATAQREGKSAKAREQEKLQAVYEKEARHFEKNAQKVAAQVIEKVGAKLASGKIGHRGIAGEAYVIAAKNYREPKLPELWKLVRNLAGEIYEILESKDLRRQKVLEIAKFRSYTDVTYLVQALEALSTRAAKLAQALSEPTKNGAGATNKTPSPKELNYELFETTDT
jgi:hypothetical protein